MRKIVCVAALALMMFASCITPIAATDSPVAVEQPTSISDGGSATSPKTGDPVLIIAGILLIALAGVGITALKMREFHPKGSNVPEQPSVPKMPPLKCHRRSDDDVE